MSEIVEGSFQKPLGKVMQILIEGILRGVQKDFPTDRLQVH
jgi:hypothetical protein